MPYLKTQQINFLGILSEWGPDPLLPLPNFYLSDFYFFFFFKIVGHPKQMIETLTPLPHYQQSWMGLIKAYVYVVRIDRCIGAVCVRGTLCILLSSFQPG